jgi:hypothetical protein
MKKVWIPILLVCYLGVSTGIVVNLHYCMDKLASAELFATKGKKCGKCGMNMHKAHGCCRDEVKIVKMEDDQKVSPLVSFELPPLEQLPVLTSEFITPSSYTVPEQNDYQNHSPPLLTGPDTYLQNCVFRI